MGNAAATASSRKGAKDAKDSQERQLRVGLNGNCNGNCNGNGASRPSTALRAGAGAKAQRTAKNYNCNGGLG
jgi:hypothetical protein